MSRVNITKSILSISSPGTHLVPSNPELASTLTRYCNNYAATLKKKHPSKFGFWASLPLPDIDLSLAEIPRAIEEGCDGFTLETNHHGYYLGDPIFDPVFSELNAHKSTIFIHPTSPCIACGPGKDPLKAAPLHALYPNPMLEFFFDTARCVANLFLSGTVARFPDITYIVPHAGGGMPPVLSRFTGFSTLVPGPWSGVSERAAREAFRTRFYFDLAGFTFPAGEEPGDVAGSERMAGTGQLAALLRSTGVGPGRLLYGSDYPFTKADGVEWLADLMDAGAKALFSDEEIEDIYHGNAEKLLGGK